jgi:5-methylcytosine-specific restriction endonuclease McrA
MNTISSFAHLTDEQLLVEVKQCARSEREATASLIASLAELDARRLYLAQGCSSLFTYCTQVLHLSEHAAYGRIEAARASRRFPVILKLLTDGSITLTAVGLLAQHLTLDNHQQVLDAARHKSKRDIELLVATLRPKPDIVSSIRKVPPPPIAPKRCELTQAATPALEFTTSTSPAAARQSRPVVAPLAPERFKIQFTVSRETYDKLRRAQELLRHSIRNGDPAAIFDRALTLLIAEAERAKLAATARPRRSRTTGGRSRHVPAAVKRAVWKRDAGQCAFTGAEGRCTEHGLLEFHHVVPYADGGRTDVENVQLRCRAHNGYESERWFGPLLARETCNMAYCGATSDA